jgi:hypothetical protein
MPPAPDPTTATLARPRGARVATLAGVVVVGLVALVLAACHHVGAAQRGRLASPAMQFEMDPVADNQRDSILEITEGGTYPSAGPGTAGAGCGCN